MNMDVETFIKENVMPSEPYEREGSKKFINAAKEGDIKTMTKLLEITPYFVHDFDAIY
jgi:hypothetical protein